MKKYLYVLIALSQVSTGLAMLPAQQSKADNKTELMQTILRNQLSEKSLSDFLSSIDIQDQIGRTALHWAAAMDNKIFMRMLKTAGADITIRDNQGKTAQELFEENKKISDRIHNFAYSNYSEPLPTEDKAQGTPQADDERPAISVIYHPNTVNCLDDCEQKDYAYGYYASLTR